MLLCTYERECCYRIIVMSNVTIPLLMLLRSTLSYRAFRLERFRYTKDKLLPFNNIHVVAGDMVHACVSDMYEHKKSGTSCEC